MERFDESLERPIDASLDAEYIKLLGSLGLYDASQDNCKNPTEAPQAWAVQSDNPNIIRGRE